MSSDTRKPAPPSPRILIVDDDAGQRSLLTSFLKSQGFDPVPVDSGEAALATLRTHEFSMMISDVRMPGIRTSEIIMLNSCARRASSAASPESTGTVLKP